MLSRLGQILLITVLISFTISCSPNEVVHKPSTLPGFVILPSTWDNGLFQGSFHVAENFQNRIYASKPLRYYDLNDTLGIMQDSVLLFERDEFGVKVGFPFVTMMRFNVAGTKLLTVRSMYHNVSEGALEEIDLLNLNTSVLLDSSYGISNAVYLSEDSIVCFTYGSSKLDDPGFYLYLKSRKSISLLYKMDLYWGLEEVAKQFDIHPINRTLLVPISTRETAPFIVQINTVTGKADTIRHLFDEHAGAALSLRYNSDGSKVLYGVYPFGALSAGAIADVKSEVGIVDLTSRVKSVIDHNPYTNNESSVALFPVWVFGGTWIAYGCSRIASNGRISVYYRIVISPVIHY